VREGRDGDNDDEGREVREARAWSSTPGSSYGGAEWRKRAKQRLKKEVEIAAMRVKIYEIMKMK
jgi:hypothetical protein